MSDSAKPDQQPSILVAGARLGASAGNSVSMDVLLGAAVALGPVGTLSHRNWPWPFHSVEEGERCLHTTIGTQPIAVHAEAFLAGRVFARRLRRWSCAWAVNSRYAGALMASGIRYAIWEASTIRDELAAIDIQASRKAGRGTGVLAYLHKTFLPIGEKLEGSLYRHASVLTAMSEYTRRRMIEVHGLDENAVHVLLHPPMPAFLRALESAASDSSAARPNRKSGGRVLAVGRMDDPRKNFSLLLDAFRLAQGVGHSLTLTVLGPHNDRWRESIGVRPESADITFRGDVSLAELARAYLDHDMLVVPSKQEGFGIVIAEALHAGLPIVSTRSGGPEQTLTESGGGFLVDSDPESVAGAIVRLAGNPDLRREMGRSGRDYARRQLSNDVFRARVRELTLGMIRA